MKRGVCLLKDCNWKHFLHDTSNDNVAPAQAYMVANMGSSRNLRAMFGPRNPRIWLGSHVSEITSNKALEGKVLLDTGANEVVRNFNYYECGNIEYNRPGTRKTQV